MTWIEDVQALEPGDLCEFHYPARPIWHYAKVVRNGGSYFWELDHDGESVSVYAEHIRCPGGPDCHGRVDQPVVTSRKMQPPPGHEHDVELEDRAAV